MLWSKLFIPTLRENPAEAEVASHQLLLRAGYIRQLSAGIYSYLFLAQRSLLKIQQIVRAGDGRHRRRRRCCLPALNPAEVWQESGRWDIMGDNMFRLKDRFGRDLCLGMTHEEVMTAIARGELRSYKQLPQIWYQIQTKFRDEPRPKSGLLRVRQFIMKDSYTFDMDQAGPGRRLRQALPGLLPHLRPLRPGVHGGGGALRRHGRQPVARVHGGVRCRRGLRGRLQGLRLLGQPGEGRGRARPRPPSPIPKATSTPEEFHTPGRKTIAEVAEFTGLPETSQMKSLVLVADGKPVLVLLRGDHQLSETKFGAIAGDPEFRPARAGRDSRVVRRRSRLARPGGREEHADPGRPGALLGRRNMIAGANRDDYHLRHVTLGEDFQAEFHDLRQVAAGDRCAALRRHARRSARPSRSGTFSSSATSTPNRWACAC